MAKVYDALVRAEAERNRRRREAAATGAAAERRPAAEPIRPSLWKRWPLARAHRAPASDAALRPEAAILEELESMGHKLDVLEERLLKKVPEVEQRLLHLMETRLESLESQLPTSMSSVADSLTRQLAQLSSRTSILLALLLLALFAILLRF